jgi:sulfur relay (sulfurtransferase) complex TusBCD TusD component (DsrE family)
MEMAQTRETNDLVLTIVLSTSALNVKVKICNQATERYGSTCTTRATRGAISHAVCREGVLDVDFS